MPQIRIEDMLKDVQRHAVTLIAMAEAGELHAYEIHDLMQGLVDTGIVWHLQGAWQREAMYLIEHGLIVPTPATLDVA